MLKEVTKMSTPAIETSINICRNCGQTAETKYVEFYENVGALFARYHRSVKAQLCKHCIDTFFWNFTGKTMLLGWWGTISFIITPFILLNNIFRFITTIGMEKPTVRIGQSPSPLWTFTAIGGFIVIALFVFSIVIGALTSSSTSSAQVETCSLQLKGYDTYIVFKGNGATSWCDEAMTKYSTSFQRYSNAPISPVVCRNTVENVEITVIDISTSGTGGSIACKSLNEPTQLC
jgi:hypothetical protein